MSSQADSGAGAATPSWKQLATIPESLFKSQILHACGIEPPPEGISTTWRDDRLYVLYCPAKDTGDYWVVSSSGTDGVTFACLRYRDASAALKATGTRPGTPTGDALRQWMRHWGWRPKDEKWLTLDQLQTPKTIILSRRFREEVKP